MLDLGTPGGGGGSGDPGQRRATPGSGPLFAWRCRGLPGGRAARARALARGAPGGGAVAAAALSRGRAGLKKMFRFSAT